MQKRESCLKEGAGWVERAGGGFCKKRGCALGKEEGVRAKTKRVKMSSEKKKNGSFEKRLILGESQFCQFTDKCEKELKRTRVKLKCKT